MTLRFTKSFLKSYRRLSQSVQQKAKDRFTLFQTNPIHPTLNNHPLHGKYSGFRSINITGDYRAVYDKQEPGIFRFIDIDTHAQLYG